MQLTAKLAAYNTILWISRQISNVWPWFARANSVRHYRLMVHTAQLEGGIDPDDIPF